MLPIAQRRALPVLRRVEASFDDIGPSPSLPQCDPRVSGVLPPRTRLDPMRSGVLERQARELVTGESLERGRIADSARLRR
jgi:hypothetical protein